MKDLEAFSEKFLNDLTALPEGKMRLDLLGRRLAGLEAGDAAEFLDFLYKKGPNDASRAFLSVLADASGLKDILDSAHYRRIYLALLEHGFKRVSRLFTDLAPEKEGIGGYDKEEEVRMERLTLGERRSLSKSNLKNTLDRLLSDPDPMVINNILNNPRITEREVLKIASKRPNSPNILKLLASHRVWSKRYEVMKALVLNPYTPPRVSIAFIELMITQDIKAIAGDKTLHPQVKLCAREILEERAVKS